MTKVASIEAAGGDTAAAGAVTYAILDQALWSQLRNADGAGSYLSSWLALQCRTLGPSVRGLLVMGEPDAGPFAPVAVWPENASPPPTLADAAQEAARQRRGVVFEESDTRIVAQPILIQDRLYGVVAVTAGIAEPQTVEIFRRLWWGAAWLEVLTRREQETIDGAMRERSNAAFDALATVLEQSEFDQACSALVTELARRVDCDIVAIGLQRLSRCKVAAVSHSASFAGRMGLIRELGHAMDEAVDQKAVVLFPTPSDWEYRVTRAHRHLVESYGLATVLTVPLQARGRTIGALTFARPESGTFTAATVEICDAVAAVVGPVVQDRRCNDRMLPAKILEAIVRQLKRLLGSSYFGRKLATLALAGLVAFFYYAKDDYAVTSSAVVQGTVQRQLVAPFTGYIASQHARAGDIVKAGETLAVMDDRDLTLEHLRQVTARQQKQTEYDRALAEHKLAESNIIRAQIDEANAQLALVDEQLARTRIKAPFDGIVVTGDLTQSVGGAVERGAKLFEIAPLDSYRVMLDVDERDVRDIRPGEQGHLRLAAMPETALPFRVERLTPMAEQGHGKNYFRVEAALEGRIPNLRPGMEGVARVDVDRRRLIRIWTQKLTDWIRLAVWRWQP